jgi:predicted Zn-ribbon and HTH transcriptional regulator
LRKDWDLTIAVTGERGAGKSNLSIEAGTIIQEGNISNALMKKFITDRMLLAPTQEEVIAIHKEKAQEYGVLVLDEAIRIAYNRESMKGSNIDMNKLYTVNRKENMCHILCIPMFYTLDPFWRNDRIKYWIHIYDRGKAVVFAQSDNPFTRDKWNLKYNEFSFRNFTMKNRRKEYEVEDFEKLSIYKRSPNFLMSFTFPKINDDLLTYYKGLTEEKRYDFDTNKKVKEEVKEEIEEKITYPTKCFHCKYEWKARIKRPKNCPRCKQKLAYSDYNTI